MLTDLHAHPPETTLHEAGLDPIDIMTLRQKFEEESGVDLSDGEVERWVVVGDILASFGRVR